MIISRFPPGQPVAERAIPTPIFNTEPKIRDYFLRKWSHDASITDFDIRNFIDWDYYIARFSTTVQKIITIPAGIQNVDNPVRRVPQPDWLKRLMERSRSSANQSKISGFFAVSKIPAGSRSQRRTPTGETPAREAGTPRDGASRGGNGGNRGNGGNEEDIEGKEAMETVETVETVETWLSPTKRSATMRRMRCELSRSCWMRGAAARQPSAAARQSRTSFA